MAELWPYGGTRIIAGFPDILTDEQANERVAEYLRVHIRSRVADCAVAERLCARGHVIGARRVLVERGYFEAYNKPQVTLVDIKASPITAIDDEAEVAGRDRYEVDVLVLATGFDSGTGPLTRIDIRGKGGRELAKWWAGGARTYIGLMVAGFPNLFTIAGPGSPSVRSRAATVL